MDVFLKYLEDDALITSGSPNHSSSFLPPIDNYCLLPFLPLPSLNDSLFNSAQPSQPPPVISETQLLFESFLSTHCLKKKIGTQIGSEELQVWI
jgi:hypothetical protein